MWVRQGSERLPIKELLGSRPVDALLHDGEAAGVSARGGRSLRETFERVLPLEIAKGKAAEARGRPPDPDRQGTGVNAS